MEELSRFANLPVYTREGTFVGNVRDLRLDLAERRVASLIVTRTNGALVPQARDVAVPYRWVSSFDDILILKYFPDLGALADDEDAQFEEIVEEGAPAPKRKVAARA